MKLTIERAALLKALSHVQSVVERRTTIPILSNVLVRAEAGPGKPPPPPPHPPKYDSACRSVRGNLRLPIVSAKDAAWPSPGVYSS